MKIEGEIKKILVIDDDAQIRGLLHRILSKAGYRPATAPGGLSALEMLKKDRPDLVILDSKMPGMDGLQTLKKIREFDKELPVIMLTGYATGQMQISALKLGVNDFLMKGTSSDRFLKTIEDVLERQRVLAARKKPPGKVLGRVMVVDDEESVRKLIKRALAEHNYEVRLASSGEEALEILKSGEWLPEVIVLDINMEGMDGLVALKEIRSLKKNINVIMMTGSGDSSYRRQALELGAVDCFKKPVNLEELELNIRIRGLGDTSSRTEEI